jgi:hypothetical protein
LADFGGFLEVFWCRVFDTASGKTTNPRAPRNFDTFLKPTLTIPPEKKIKKNLKTLFVVFFLRGTIERPKTIKYYIVFVVVGKHRSSQRSYRAWYILPRWASHFGTTKHQFASRVTNLQYIPP